MAILLVRENRAGRPQNYVRDVTVQASYASRTMFWSGLIILAFILFHLAQFTLLIVEPKYQYLRYILDGHEVPDVYAMMILGFANPAVSGFYILAVWLLCVHLSHGFSSMFQSVGLRNEKWRKKLNQTAQAYGLIIFIGFASIPAAVLFSEYSSTPILPTREILRQMNAKAWDPAFPVPMGINYLLIIPENQSASAQGSTR
jgi:succinate dehydrogenase / fumarate reductase cytochrome b subunit